MAAFVKCLDALDDLMARDRDNEGQQCLHQRDNTHRRREELRRIDGDHKTVVSITDNWAGGLSERATIVIPCSRAILTASTTSDR